MIHGQAGQGTRCWLHYEKSDLQLTKLSASCSSDSSPSGARPPASWPSNANGLPDASSSDSSSDSSVLGVMVGPSAPELEAVAELVCDSGLVCSGLGPCGALWARVVDEVRRLTAPLLEREPVLLLREGSLVGVSAEVLGSDSAAWRWVGGGVDGWGRAWRVEGITAGGWMDEEGG